MMIMLTMTMTVMMMMDICNKWVHRQAIYLSVYR